MFRMQAQILKSFWLSLPDWQILSIRLQVCNSYHRPWDGSHSLDTGRQEKAGSLCPYRCKNQFQHDTKRTLREIRCSSIQHQQNRKRNLQSYDCNSSCFGRRARQKADHFIWVISVSLTGFCFFSCLQFVTNWRLQVIVFRIFFGLPCFWNPDPAPPTPWGRCKLTKIVHKKVTSGVWIPVDIWTHYCYHIIGLNSESGCPQSVSNIEFYSTADGNSELWDFLDDLQQCATTSKDARIQHKQIVQYIQLLEDHGTRLGENITKHLDDGIWELRPGNNRVLYFFFKDDTFVLLHQFRKKTRKTPPREIEKAKAERADWISRKESNHGKLDWL